MEGSATKVCRKCGRELPATAEFFQPRKDHGGRFSSPCRECRKAYNAEYHAAHREAHRVQSLAYYQANHEKCKEWQKAYHIRHRERQIVARKEHYSANAERYKEAARAYRYQCPGVVLFREWRSQGCVVCGETDVRCIQAHHIDPGEKEHNLARIYDYETVRAELAKCVPVCANHHLIIHEEMRHGFKGMPLTEIIEHLKREASCAA